MKQYNPFKHDDSLTATEKEVAEALQGAGFYAEKFLLGYSHEFDCDTPECVAPKDEFFYTKR